MFESNVILLLILLCWYDFLSNFVLLWFLLICQLSNVWSEAFCSINSIYCRVCSEHGSESLWPPWSNFEFIEILNQPKQQENFLNLIETSPTLPHILQTNRKKSRQFQMCVLLHHITATYSIFIWKRKVKKKKTHTWKQQERWSCISFVDTKSEHTEQKPMYTLFDS